MRDRWCPNCNQYVQPRRGRESGFLVLVLVAILAFGGWELGPVIAPYASGASAQVLGAAIGVLVAAALVGASIAIQATKLTCPVCGTRSLGRAK
jgi:FtsH-binding integral membrane protein